MLPFEPTVQLLTRERISLRSPNVKDKARLASRPRKFEITCSRAEAALFDVSVQLPCMHPPTVNQQQLHVTDGMNWRSGMCYCIRRVINVNVEDGSFSPSVFSMSWDWSVSALLHL